MSPFQFMRPSPSRSSPYLQQFSNSVLWSSGISQGERSGRALGLTTISSRDAWLLSVTKMSFCVKLYLEKKIENKTKSGRESSSTRKVYSMKLKTRQSI